MIHRYSDIDKLEEGKRVWRMDCDDKPIQDEYRCWRRVEFGSIVFDTKEELLKYYIAIADRSVIYYKEEKKRLIKLFDKIRKLPKDSRK